MQSLFDNEAKAHFLSGPHSVIYFQTNLSYSPVNFHLLPLSLSPNREAHALSLGDMHSITAQ